MLPLRPLNKAQRFVEPLLAPTLRGWVGAVSVKSPSGGDASDKGVTTAPSRPLSKARGVTLDCSWPLPCGGG